ncbi:hypothetical protein ACIXFW_12190 [Bacteroides fragilis]
MNAQTIRCGLSLFVIVGVVVIPWTQQESTTPSFCSMATKRKNMIKINFLQLLSMSNVDIEKTFRNKLVYFELKDGSYFKGTVTGFEYAVNEPHLIVIIIIDQCHKVFIDKISFIELI